MKHRIPRRMTLSGLGGIAIGLPLLEEMTACAAASQRKQDVPVRAFNVFFGLGIPAPLQTEGFDGVLEPLKPLKDKLLIMRHVDQVRCDEAGINAHFDGASGAKCFLAIRREDRRREAVFGIIGFGDGFVPSLDSHH